MKYISKATEIKIESLNAQARGYLTLSKGHCKAGNAYHSRLYLETTKRLISEAQSFVDHDSTNVINITNILKAA